MINHPRPSQFKPQLDTIYFKANIKVIELIKLLPEDPDEQLFEEDNFFLIIDLANKLTTLYQHTLSYLKKEVQIGEELSRDILQTNLHLLSILRSLRTAVANKDHFAAHDLITQELKDNLVQWRLKLLPLIQSLV